MHDVVQDLGEVRAAERQLAGGQFVENNPQTEQIGALVERLAQGLLGTHIPAAFPGWCPPESAASRPSFPARRPIRREPFGQSEIQDLDLASFIQADVGRLDITVHDPAGMSGVQRVGHLGGQIDDLRNLEPSFFQDRIQRPAFDEFHGDKRQPVFRLAHVVHNADVRMIERRGGPGFLQKSLPSLGVRGQFRRQELDRRFAFEPSVLGQKDLSHAAGTEFGVMR